MRPMMRNPTLPSAEPYPTDGVCPLSARNPKTLFGVVGSKYPATLLLFAASTCALTEKLYELSIRACRFMRIKQENEEKMR